MTTCAALVSSALVSVGCGSGSDDDYFYVKMISGESDTLLVTFTFTCGSIDLTWDGTFSGDNPIVATLTVHADNHGQECARDPRTVTFDAGPMKRAFREAHPEPTPLELRITSYDPESGSLCVKDLFEAPTFRVHICE